MRPCPCADSSIREDVIFLLPTAGSNYSVHFKPTWSYSISRQLFRTVVVQFREKGTQISEGRQVPSINWNPDRLFAAPTHIRTLAWITFKRSKHLMRIYGRQMSNSEFKRAWQWRIYGFWPLLRLQFYIENRAAKFNIILWKNRLPNKGHFSGFDFATQYNP